MDAFELLLQDMSWSIFQIVVGAVLLGELIFCIAVSKSAPDYTWYLCRPFGIPFTMGVGAILRLVCAIAGGILLYRGIVSLI